MKRWPCCTAKPERTLSPTCDTWQEAPGPNHCDGPTSCASPTPPTAAPAAAASATSAEECFTVESLGRTARALMGDRRRGYVIAVFRRSFYARFGDAVICLGSRGIGQGPLNALCWMPSGLSWSDRVANGAPVTRDDATLLVGARLRFDYAEALSWQAPVAVAVSVPSIHAGLARLAAAARRRMPGGFGALLAAPLAPIASADEEMPDPLLRSAAAAIAALRDWLTAALSGSPRPPPALAALIGLGPGLTPSGDDFLCGVMATLHYLGGSAVARRLAEGVLAAAAETNLISAAYLRCAAEGETSEVLFNALSSIAAGGDGRLEACLDAVHSASATPPAGTCWRERQRPARQCAQPLALPRRRDYPCRRATNHTHSKVSGRTPIFTAACSVTRVRAGSRLPVPRHRRWLLRPPLRRRGASAPAANGTAGPAPCRRRRPR